MQDSHWISSPSATALCTACSCRWWLDWMASSRLALLLPSSRLYRLCLHCSCATSQFILRQSNEITEKLTRHNWYSRSRIQARTSVLENTIKNLVQGQSPYVPHADEVSWVKYESSRMVLAALSSAIEQFQPSPIKSESVRIKKNNGMLEKKLDT